MIEEIRKKTGLVPQQGNVTGARTTTMAVGGAFRHFIEPQTVEQLQALIAILNSNAQPWRILGGGSNIIVSDRGIEDWVIRLGRGFRQFEKVSENRFLVNGSMPLMTLCRELGDAGYAGLEFAGGIPASFGGAVRMNAGAHGGAMGDVVEAVTIITPQGELVTVERTALVWNYRKSMFQDGCVVVSAVIKLASGDVAAIQQRRVEFLQERKKRQPLTYPSAGSIFKNPPSLSAGAVLEQVGMKGARLGKAEVSSLHANWIINPGKDATASDVEGLISLCREKALAKTGIVLEREVIAWS